jgi:hypothetical protein
VKVLLMGIGTLFRAVTRTLVPNTDHGGGSGIGVADRDRDVADRVEESAVSKLCSDGSMSSETDRSLLSDRVSSPNPLAE